MIYRHQLRLDNDLVLKKILAVMFSGYCLALIFIYTNVLHWEKPFFFLSLLSFCPFVGLLLMILKKYKYEGDLSVLFLAIMLNSFGLVVLYRLDISSPWFLTRSLHYEGTIPLVFKQQFYSLVALLGLVIGIISRFWSKVLLIIENRREILIWGLIAFALLALPKLFGFSMWLTQDKSFQPSEFAFKIIFLIFISKYYERKSSELLLKHYPLKEVLKLVSGIFCGIGIFFFVPLVLLQKELGTALLIGLTFIILTTYVTGRFSFFLAGLALIVLAVWTGVVFSDHVEKRVIAAWLNWREFAFMPFREGEKLYPGFQIFTALSSIRLSPWGVGIGNGILRYATMNKTIVPKAVHDFVAIPVASELGVIGIVVIGLGYLILLDKALPKNKSLSFPNILAAGIAIALMIQGLYNLSCVFALLPVTGIPLPWISYGGSAIFANYILVGFFITILNDKRATFNEK